LAECFAVDLERALQAAIEQQEYPVGCGSRPLTPKLAHLLRRLAQNGFTHHLSPQLASLLATVVRGGTGAEQHTVLVGGMDAHVAAGQALMAVLSAVEPSRLQEYAFATGFSQPDGDLCILDVAILMDGLNIELPVDDGSSSEAEEAVGREMLASERGPMNNAGAVSSPFLTMVQVSDLLSRELTPEDYELLLRLDESVEQRPGHTADASRVDALSEHVVESNEDVGFKCAVCFDVFVSGELAKRLQCSHMFHTDCISMWLVHSKNSCPVCNAKAV